MYFLIELVPRIPDLIMANMLFTGVTPILYLSLLANVLVCLYAGHRGCEGIQLRILSAPWAITVRGCCALNLLSTATTVSAPGINH